MKYTLAEHGPRIQAFLDRILPLARLDVNFEISDDETPHPQFENPDLRVKFEGEDVSTLLANKAEVLLALELLTQEMLRLPPDHHNRIAFDAHDHRLLRTEELRLSALQAAERVRATGIPFQFNPMNSRERRILHLALRDEAGLRSESEGFEPRRAVVIYPANMPSRPHSPAPLAPPRPGGARPLPPRRRR